MIDRRDVMLHTALGRVQASADLRLRATEMLADALRAASASGATVDVLAIESGLPASIIRKVTRERRLGELALFMEGG